MSPLVIGLFGLTAFGAPEAERASPPGGGALGAGLCRQIECTPEQEQQVTRIFAAHMEDVADDRGEVQRLRNEMAAELTEAQPDTEKLRRLQRQLSQVQATMAQKRLDSTLEVHGVLTPAQRKMLAEHMMMRPGPHMRGRPGGRGRSGR
jgi:Spy/CpxP family protein refolding chaperone